MLGTVTEALLGKTRQAKEGGGAERRGERFEVLVRAAMWFQ